MTAAELDEDAWLRRLADGGVAPQAATADGEPLALFAVRHCMPRLLHALLDAGIDPNVRYFAGEPLLHEAVTAFEQSPHGWAGIAVPQMIDALVRAGADLDARGGNDFTPLHVAAQRGSDAICRQLVALGANPLAVAEPSDSHGGQTPYEVAEFYGRERVASAIREGVAPEQLEARRTAREAAHRVYLNSLRRRWF